MHNDNYYPPGAANDKRAPYNRTDEDEDICENCKCEICQCDVKFEQDRDDEMCNIWKKFKI